LPNYQWTVRAFGPNEIDLLSRSDSAHPWSQQLGPRVRSAGRLRWAIVPVATQTIYNSAVPYGYNDGAIWAGKGITQAVSGGLSARMGIVSLTVAPTAFWAENTSFPLHPNGLSGKGAFVHAFYGGSVDMPQRFGNDAYQRIDPGQSTLRIDAGPAAVGVSTANEFWGPSIESPLILGNNAPGFPHIFIGTSSPTNVYVGTVHGRVLYGIMSQSGYALGNPGKRYSASAVGTFSPRGASQLELGAARFFHIVSPGGGLPPRFFSRPFDGLLKQTLPATQFGGNDDPNDNQLASVFLRWTFPKSGVEAFVEYGREDHNWNIRDLIGQPDHDAAYLLGMQRLWKSVSSDRYTVLRVEVLNSRMSHLTQGAPQTIWYTHDVNGHTERGQVLGAAGALGGGSAVIAVTRYSPSGSTTFRLGRLMMAEVTDSTGLSPKRADVTQELGIERMRFGQGNRPDATLGLTGVFDYNHNATRATTFNLNLVVRMEASSRGATQPH
jgi:hypothetical protein